MAGWLLLGGSGCGDGQPVPHEPFTPGAVLGTSDQFEVVTLDDGVAYLAARDEVLVHLEDAVGAADIRELETRIAEVGGRVLGSSGELHLLRVRTGREQETMDALAAMPGVRAATLNLVGGLPVGGPPSDLLDRPSPMAGDGAWWGGALDARRAWGIADGGAGAVVAVLSAVVSPSVPCIERGRFAVLGYSASEDAADDTEGGERCRRAVCLIGGAADGADGDSGLAPRANVAVVNIAPRSRSWCVPGIGHCLTHIWTAADVLSGVVTAFGAGASALVVPVPHTADCDDSRCRQRRTCAWRRALLGAAALAERSDGLIVLPAGDDGEKEDGATFCDERDGRPDGWTSPWRGQTLAVGAFDAERRDARWSRAGDAVDVFAPGVAVSAPADGGALASGTWYAAALAAAAASLVFSENPTLSPAEVRHLLLSSARRAANVNAPGLLLDVGAGMESASLTHEAALVSRAAKLYEAGEERQIHVEVTVPAAADIALDALFLIDVTKSYEDDIESLRRRAAQIWDGVAASAADSRVGVAVFSDFPLEGFGSVAAGDNAYELVCELTADRQTFVEAVEGLALRDGGDDGEAQLEAAYQAATGAGRDTNGDGDLDDPEDVAAAAVGWRDGATKLLFLSTDAWFHDERTRDYPGASWGDTLEALADRGIRVVGLGSAAATLDLQRLCDDSGGVCFDLSEDSAEVVRAVQDALGLTGRAVELVWEWIRVPAGFDVRVEPTCVADVLPGASVGFTVEVVNHNPVGRFPQRYRLVGWVRAAGALIHRLSVRLAVPAAWGG